MNNKVEIDALRITNKQDLHSYIKEAFGFPEYYGKNLDALYDCLSELDEDTDIVFDKRTLELILDNAYAYKVLMVFGKAAAVNPHLKIRFRRNEDD